MSGGITRDIESSHAFYNIQLLISIDFVCDMSDEYHLLFKVSVIIYKQTYGNCTMNILFLFQVPYIKDGINVSCHN